MSIYTKTKNGVAIFSFENPYWVWFSMHKSVVSLLCIGITSETQKYMHFFFDAIACGLLAALTWMGLVWMSPNRPIESGKAWVQGVGIVAIANIFVWIALVGLNLRWIALWAICFLIINVAIARLVFPLCEGIKIPNIWALVIHPVAIAAMSVLLGGAVGFL